MHNATLNHHHSIAGNWFAVWSRALVRFWGFQYTIRGKTRLVLPNVYDKYYTLLHNYARRHGDNDYPYTSAFASTILIAVINRAIYTFNSNSRTSSIHCTLHFDDQPHLVFRTHRPSACHVSVVPRFQLLRFCRAHPSTGLQLTSFLQCHQSACALTEDEE